MGPIFQQEAARTKCMGYLIKPEKTDAEAQEFVTYARDTYGISDAELLARVVGRSLTIVQKWLKER